MNDLQTLSDFFDLIRYYKEEDKRFAHRLNKIVRSISSNQIANKALKIGERIQFEELYKRSLYFDSLEELDAYLLYIEFDRPAEKKFYEPRRAVLKTVVDDLQDLYDHKIKFLAISLPPRVGKSTLGIFFLTWLMGKHPDLPSLMTGYSDTLVKGFQKEAISIINSAEYLWHDVFPEYQIKKISSELGTIDINTIDINIERRYPTLTCRSIEGSLTGSVDIKCLAYVDDVVSDHEEACNERRMEKKMEAYANQVKDRMVGEYAMELHIGTRWGVDDVIGRLQDQYSGNPLYRFRVIPAMDENDESNFNYPYDLGFSTAKYRDIRETLENAGDIASWFAKYQGEPYVREGLVFPREDIHYFKKKDIDLSNAMRFFACDVAWGGGDTLSGPFAYMLNDSLEDIYIVDWIFNKGDKDVTRPIVEARMIEHQPHYSRFEANNGGEMYAESVENDLKILNYRFNIESVTTTGGRNASKHAEILAYAPDIRRLHFLDPSEQSPEYANAMKELCRYLQNGKAKHDDAPDSLKQLMKMILDSGSSVVVGDRLW